MVRFIPHASKLKHKQLLPTLQDIKKEEKLESNLRKETNKMCISCGCGDVLNDHGDKRNITLRDIAQSATSSGNTLIGVLNNLSRTCGNLATQAATIEAAKTTTEVAKPVETAEPTKGY
jgi:ribosomal protein S27AE